MKVKIYISGKSSELLRELLYACETRLSQQRHGYTHTHARARTFGGVGYKENKIYETCDSALSILIKHYNNNNNNNNNKTRINYIL